LYEALTIKNFIQLDELKEYFPIFSCKPASMNVLCKFPTGWTTPLGLSVNCGLNPSRVKSSKTYRIQRNLNGLEGLKY